MHEPNEWLFWVLSVLVMAGFTGWWVAEADNRIMQREIKNAHHSVVIKRNDQCL